MNKLWLYVLLLILVIIIAPVLTILSLNTLFALGIPLTVWTWLSIVWLQAVTFGGLASRIGDKL